ncbi:MAG: DegT/DnrJ/EryC1/StrS aminotransferase family protein [Deltaproteobacteria bacterium]|nr:DegT/DnrJ/EryC1/StrS aminotransferase family protein [Deltaproteobacteria bacterium]
MDEQEEKAVLNVLRSGWLVQGPNVAEFENRFKTFAGVRNAIAVTSCTTALHLALLAAGIGPGDEVLVPSFTFLATANAVEYTGAKPVFVDVGPRTFNMNPEEIGRFASEKAKVGGALPKCILPVSLFGLCADMETIHEIASRYGMKVVEDAACGLGAYRNEHHAGAEALLGCFSFHPRKSITTGEGGMVVTDDDELADKIRRLRDHGAAKTDLERHLSQGGSLLPAYDVLGFNYRMTDLQGALGVAQMSKLPQILEARRAAAARYDNLLEGIPEILPPWAPPGYRHAYQSYVCLYLPDSTDMRAGGIPAWDRIGAWNRERNRIMAYMERQGISVRQGTHAVHTLGYYQRKYGLRDEDFAVSYMADRLSITLPLYVGISVEDQERVIRTLIEGIKISQASAAPEY